MEGEPVFEESSGLSKLLRGDAACEYDMGIVDNLCSPGWDKDLTISVVSLDRKFEFKASIPPRSLAADMRILW